MAEQLVLIDSMIAARMGSRPESRPGGPSSGEPLRTEEIDPLATAASSSGESMFYQGPLTIYTGTVPCNPYLGEGRSLPGFAPWARGGAPAGMGGAQCPTADRLYCGTGHITL